ncbi:glycosyltransferase family 2 protein [Microbacterium sp. cx-55]|uniref:glycosyltransferase n=1 Tax=unclassified Microbacterium TaxID=2609290 RepID=UPI001CC154B7|nr:MULTISPECIES: glycosyltransferase family 2 protein [unclassified Microbacterium]MBZ4487404.1 glycosyltransferase family 2 protein [Microbacterium sp. cx-55]MCC4908477.1 glycosyltransferase family 2 protein [Microbacterium sp. cx-59]UGB35424.1 glycosyltransferase family 2 protein [Microbacterium sp. cx-55]
MQVTVVVPTFNEAPNVAELVRRVAASAHGYTVDILFVDDSTDDTPRVIEQVAATAPVPVRLIHRDNPVGGLGGAVTAGIAAADSDICVVMDGDLQHPPETIANLVTRFRRGDVDLVVASRYAEEGAATGLSDASRVLVSRASTYLTKAMFPLRLKEVSDPMTGFFLVDRRALDLEELRPRGFKILLEILARHPVRVVEVPFSFADRHAGASKASFRQGLHFLAQLTALRFGKMSMFAIIGGLGAIANLAIVWVLAHVGMGDISSMLVAAEITIIANFLLQERFVFQDVKADASGIVSRFAKSFAFNNAELIVRIPITTLIISNWHISVVIATGITLVAAFVLRFLFHSLVVYAPRRAGARKTSPARALVEELDRQAVSPGEL